MLLVLALAGLTYALLDQDDGEPEAGKGGASSPATTGGKGAGATETRDGPSPSSSATDDASEDEGDDGGHEEETPAVTVSVAVTGTRTEYHGACPPPHEEAPSFTATFTVDRLPAEVRYRWATEDGSAADRGWRTLSFPADGGRTKRDTVVVTTYSESGELHGRIGGGAGAGARDVRDRAVLSGVRHGGPVGRGLRFGVRWGRRRLLNRVDQAAEVSTGR